MNFFFALLLLLGPLAATARTSTVRLENRDARNLIAALDSSGAFFPCAVGTCGTEALNITCMGREHIFGWMTYDCELIAQDEEGGRSPLTASGRDARALFDALKDAGFETQDCESDVCVKADRILCQTRETSDNRRLDRCEIVQAN